MQQVHFPLLCSVDTDDESLCIGPTLPSTNTRQTRRKRERLSHQDDVCQGLKGKKLGGLDTHSDLDVVVGKDQRSVGTGKLCGGHDEVCGHDESLGGWKDARRRKNEARFAREKRRFTLKKIDLLPR